MTYPALSKEQKQEIKQRDGNRCVECGSTEELTIDHIVPLLYGGTNQQENLQTLCRTCNARKGSRIRLLWLEKLKQLWYFTDILTRFKNEWRSVQSSQDKRLNGVSAELTGRLNALQATFDKYKSASESSILHLNQRIQALEDYHKLEWKEETVQVRRYVKRKKGA